MMEILERHELMYRLIGGVLATLVVGMIVYGIARVVDAFDIALNPNLIKPPQAVTFNLDLAKELRLVK